MSNSSHNEFMNEDEIKCPEETKGQRFVRLFRNSSSWLSYMLTFRNFYYMEVMQALNKVESEYKTIKKKSDIAFLDHETQEAVQRTIQKLICEARKERNYSKIWPLVHQIELLLIKLYDENMLEAHLSIVRNNLYVLEDKDEALWKSKLDEYEGVNIPLVEKSVEKVTKSKEETVTEKVTYHTKKKAEAQESAAPAESLEQNTADQKKHNLSIENLRALLYTITAAINEARRVEYMTNDLKRVLLGRIMRWTLIVGFFAWVFAYSLVRDPLVNYAILLGILGGFFSRLHYTESLDFKPPAFALLAQYSYVQPLIGGIGAVLMYFILLSPLGTEIINSSLYLNEAETRQYIIEKYEADLHDSTCTRFFPPFRVNSFVILDTTSQNPAQSNDVKPDTSNSNTKAKVKAVVKGAKTTNQKNQNAAVNNTAPKSVEDTTRTSPAQIISKQLITMYPKPMLLLILAFLSGFSEKFFLGTVNKIVGSKFITVETEQKKAEKEADKKTENSVVKKTT